MPHLSWLLRGLPLPLAWSFAISIDSGSGSMVSQTSVWSADACSDPSIRRAGTLGAGAWDVGSSFRPNDRDLPEHTSGVTSDQSHPRPRRVTSTCHPRAHVGAALRPPALTELGGPS